MDSADGWAAVRVGLALVFMGLVLHRLVMSRRWPALGLAPADKARIRRVAAPFWLVVAAVGALLALVGLIAVIASGSG